VAGRQLLDEAVSNAVVLVSLLGHQPWNCLHRRLRRSHTPL
jgi:hypothetical protein